MKFKAVTECRSKENRDQQKFSGPCIHNTIHVKFSCSAKWGFLPSCTACKVLRPIGGGSWRPSSPSWKGCTPILGDQYSSPLRAGCNLDWKEKEWDCIFMTGCHLKIDTQCFRGGFAVQSRYNAELSSVMLLGQCVYRVSHGASTLQKQLVNRVNVLRDIGWKTVGSYPSHLLYFYDLWLNFLRKIILENLLFHRVLIIIWNWYRIFSFSIIFKI